MYSKSLPLSYQPAESHPVYHWLTFILLLNLLFSGWFTVQAAQGIPPADFNIPNHGDGNNDGIADVQQPNVASLPDKVTGQYITLELNNECTINNIETDLAETLVSDDQKHFFPQGLLYFDARCPQTKVTLYFHGLHQLDQRWILQKYGPQTPGDTSTIGWYQMPGVTFDTVMIDGQPVVRASYTLTDGDLGDDTGVDGHLVDPITVSSGTDVDNVISFLAKNYTASTQQGVATITVIRTGTQGALSIAYTTADDTALAGQDYQTASGTLSWADGERGEKTFTVNLLGSATIGRTFTATLNNLTGGNNPSLGINLTSVTITNDSVTPISAAPPTVANFISFSANRVNVQKNSGLATLTVIRNGTVGALSVDYATSDNTAVANRDYQPATGTLSWAEGDVGEKSITVNLLSGATANTQFLVTLSNLTATGTTAILGLNPAVVALTNDSVTPPAVTNFISFATNNFSAQKNDGLAILTVIRQGATGALSVDYATSDNTAIAGRDYQAMTGTLSWAEGDVSEKTIMVILPSGATVNTQFLVTLSNLTTTGPATILGLNPTIVTIGDTTTTPTTQGGTEPEASNLVSFSTKNFTASRNGGPAMLTVNRNGTQGSLSVNYTTSDNTALAGRDYQPATGTFSWADGERGDKLLTVNLLNTATVGTTLNVTLSQLTLNAEPAPANTSLGINTATLQITDETVPVVSPPQTSVSESLIAFVANGYKVLKTDGVATLKVNRSGNTTGALFIDYTTQNATAIAGIDYQATSGTLAWADGESGEKNVTVTLLASATAGNTFIVRLSNLTGAPGKISSDTAVLTIFDKTTTSGGITAPGTGTTPIASGGTGIGTTTPTLNHGTSVLPPSNDGIGAITQTTSAPAITPTSPTPTTTPSVANTNGEIYNAGGQELPPIVSEAGSISHATVLTDTENHGLLSNLTIESSATVTGGELTGTIINQGTLKDVEFLGISLSGGTLAGTIVNNSRVGGIIHDVTLAPSAILSGGKVGGTLNAAPDSRIIDVQLMANTTIHGGTLAGNISGTPNSPATITQATFSSGTTLAYVTIISPVELPDDVVIGPGVTLPPKAEIAVNNVLAPTQIQHIEANVLSTLPPEAISGLTAAQMQQIPPPALSGLTAEQSAALSQPAVATLNGEQVAQIPPVAFSGLHADQVAVLKPEAVGAVSSEQVSQIPPPAFRAVSAEQLAVVKKETLAGMTPAQFFYLPTESLRGLTSANLGGLSPAVINQFTPTEVLALQPAAVKNMPANEVGTLLTNLDLNKVTIQEAAPLVPPNWKLDSSTGVLVPPAGTILNFKELSPPAELSPLVVLPPSPSLDSSFGIGGKGGATAQEGINTTLQLQQQAGVLPPLTLSQNKVGILQVVSETNDQLYFMCPLGSITQAAPNTSPAVKVTDGGFYQVTTPALRQFTMVPAPKDPENLSKVLADGSVIMGKRGDVFLEVPNQVRQSSGGAREVVMFDSLIEAAPEDVCEEIAGKKVCDFVNAPPERQPGIHEVIEENKRQKTGDPKKKKIIYEDGTAQVFYPTVLSPDTFIDQAQKTLKDAKKVILQANGMFKMSYQGRRYLATPNFEVKSRALQKNEQIKPNIVLRADGHVSYTVTLERPPAAAGTRQARADGSGAREVLVFDLLLEPAPEDVCEEIAGKVVCDLPNTSDKAKTGSGS